jgi:hypothetical protein
MSGMRDADDRRVRPREVLLERRLAGGWGPAHHRLPVPRLAVRGSVPRRAVAQGAL